MSFAGRAYAGAMTLAAPALRLSLHARVRRGKEVAGRLGERRGLESAPRPAGRLVWLHAASVGETVSILPVLEELRRAAVTPLVTTGTVTSATLLRQRFPDVLHRFAPLDVPGWVARFLDHWRPDAGALVESELWPNLLAACRQRGVPLMLLNARLSARSAARWRHLAGLAGDMFAAIARIEAQSAADAARFSALGARCVAAPGNLKYAAAALPCDAAELARVAALIEQRPVWLAASTHPGEEAIAAAVHRRLALAHPGLLTIIVPRHPERGARIAAELGAPRRAAGQPPEGLWIADTLGELGLWYRLASVVFVGRSLLPPGGGQNPLEPARLGCAVAIGPLADNFAEPVAALAAAGGIARVRDDATLADWVSRMLIDTAARERAGAAARVAAGRAEELPRRMAAALLELAGA
jgi:3-deoxy-D-manno-octulosonic-acid transferase